MKKKIKQFKWAGTGFMVLGAFINACGIYPLGVIIMLTGSAFWTTVATLIKDRPLWITNVVLAIVTIVGLGVNLIT